MFTLIPKTPVFFELFEKAAAQVHEGATALSEFFDRFDRIADRAKSIHDIEDEGDRLAHETMERLHKTFITPLDREDIHALAGGLDDILDLIDEAASRVVLYRIEEPTRDAKDLTGCLVRSAALIAEMVVLLRRGSPLEEMLRMGCEIHQQENEADRIEQHALAALFETGHAAKDIIKWKDVYEDLEAACDRCEDVSNILEGIVLKNA